MASPHALLYEAGGKYVGGLHVGISVDKAWLAVPAVLGGMGPLRPNVFGDIRGSRGGS